VHHHVRVLQQKVPVAGQTTQGIDDEVVVVVVPHGCDYEHPLVLSKRLLGAIQTLAVIKERDQTLILTPIHRPSLVAALEVELASTPPPPPYEQEMPFVLV